MSGKSEIEWTDATWNPLRGCTKISPGCKHCYAEAFAERFRDVPGHPYEQGFDLRLVPEKLEEPLRWKRPRWVFVNSMADLFHELVPAEYIGLVAQVIRSASWHRFQLLTKRADRLAALTRINAVGLDLSNVITGVSVEDRRYGLPRIEHLRRARVSQRFLSIEPLLEDLGPLDLTGIDWVIVGGESHQSRPRPMEAEWVRSIRDQCDAQGVAFFFKQWGGRNGREKKEAGRILDERTHDAMPKVEASAVPSARDRNRKRAELDKLVADAGPLELLAPVTRLRVPRERPT